MVFINIMSATIIDNEFHIQNVHMIKLYCFIVSLIFNTVTFYFIPTVVNFIRIKRDFVFNINNIL